MVTPANPVWGIDLGGTKVEGVILKDANSVEVIERLRVPTESEKGYKHIVSQIGLCVELLKDRTGLNPAKLGIGTPGVLDPILHTMKNCNTTVLNGQPLQADLEELFGLEINMANDANCFAYAEAKLGAVKEHFENPEVVFGVIMGTGVGGGVVVNGKLLTGRQGIGGEWGHTYLDDSAGPCYCGNTGCVENLISGTALEKYYNSRSDEKRKLKEIVARHQQGIDTVATETIKRLIYFFGKGLANVIDIIDPTVIVLGGGVGNIDLLYTEGVEMVKKFVFNNRLDTVFLRPKLGDSAGVFGAALL
ncbi:MAG: ROK family protein [Saprospiraceae bacterium]|nr:ROK family protein [Saprospiraceae bacterium]